MTPQPTNPQSEKVEPIVWLLAGLVIVFALFVIGISKWSPSDGQTFQVISNVLMAVVSLFGAKVAPQLAKKTPPPTTPDVPVSSNEVK